MTVQREAEFNLKRHSTVRTSEEPMQVDPAPSAVSALAHAMILLPSNAMVNNNPLISEPSSPTISELLQDYIKWICLKP